MLWELLKDLGTIVRNYLPHFDTNWVAVNEETGEADILYPILRVESWQTVYLVRSFNICGYAFTYRTLRVDKGVPVNEPE